MTDEVRLLIEGKVLASVWQGMSIRSTSPQRADEVPLRIRVVAGAEIDLPQSRMSSDRKSEQLGMVRRPATIVDLEQVPGGVLS